ncbi:MAG: sulfate adenylyltransferase subunit CysN [Bryobacterales bacterium]|nr:sulfate adenylyltransferase subunit CysN [Bryobacterales bacterium]
MASFAEKPLLSAEHFVAGDGEKDLLRFSTAGSVDDGKSTLIGRLLHDTNGAYEDQIDAVRKSKVNRSTGAFDFSLLTDGLKAEREQGITIDVAYRYFATSRRKFIIADTPGHEQYTRNMATGASTADLAIILVDARHGVLPQTRRHAYISWLLGIEHLVVTINKMDLVSYSEARFHEIRAQFEGLRHEFPGATIHYLPVSALEGDNVVVASPSTPWYTGPSLLELLENIEINRDAARRPFRLPVQYVIRPDLHFRGFAGQIASGVVRPGDTVLSLPSGEQATVSRIVTFDGDLAEAYAPMSVNLVLDREIDLSRGDMLVSPTALPSVSRHLEATLVWMSPEPLHAERAYRLRHGSREVSAQVASITHRMEVDRFLRVPATGLSMNEIADVLLETASPLFVDPYRENRLTGAVVLVDPISNNTVAAGMILKARPDEAAERRRRERSVTFQAARVTPLERQHRYGHRPALIVLDDPEDAEVLERACFDRGWLALWVDGQGPNIDPEEPWLRGAIEAGNLVLLSRCSLKEGAGRALPSGIPLLRVPSGNGARETMGKRVLAQLAAWGVIPAEDQAGDGEGI